jgi:dTDP-4-amino-4,6-dideoxygalactose transaminase
MSKRRIDDLAVFGGKPAFSELAHVGRPNIGDRDRLLARIGDALDRRWLTNDGPYARELEARLCDTLKVKHCLVLCNGTVALEIAIRAAGLTGEVLVPSFTFAATAHALQWQRVTPVFCDIDPATHMLDVAALEKMITPQTTGIIGVHLWGRGCDVAGLEALAARRNLTLLFDAAHAMGCSIGGRMIGGFGKAEVFSFHATKFFNTLEGGAIATNDDEMANKIRLMRNFGFAGYDNVVYVGTNGKMNEFSAAVGLTNLEGVEGVITCNRRNHEQYRSELEGVPGLRLLAYDEKEHNNYQYVVLEVDDSATGVTRDQLITILWAENVIARKYFYPGVHNMEPYRTLFPDAGRHLPHTEQVTKKVLVLPTGTAMSPEAISAICQILRTSITAAAEVALRLAKLEATRQ